jgi:1-acyl-sn-glycerol-3-phosphate acyltransferase
VTAPARPEAGRPAGPGPTRDRSRLALAWYAIVRLATSLYGGLTGGIRATGRENLPAAGGALLVSNHLSHLDVFVLGLGVPRPLNYVARSSLFVPPLGALIRSVGGFPIDREGSGTAGLKETLRRLKAGGIVLIFPEGTRSRDGELGPLKPGIAALARARVPIVPAAVAGTFEAWPADRAFPRAHPIRVHYGPPIPADVVASLTSDDLTALIERRIREAQVVARDGLRRDLDRRID